MIKNLLRLLASSATFVAVMLVANVAIANPNSSPKPLQVNDKSAFAIEQQSSVNLNVVSPFLMSAHQSSSSLAVHFGCSCGVCTQGINTSNI